MTLTEYPWDQLLAASLPYNLVMQAQEGHVPFIRHPRWQGGTVPMLCLAVCQQRALPEVSEELGCFLPDPV